jgi:excisionase family DNA binding protein
MTRLNEYLRIAEAARVLGVSQNTLRLWAAAGKVPVRRNPANGYRLFRRQDLEEFLQRIESAATRTKKTTWRSGGNRPGVGEDDSWSLPN